MHTINSLQTIKSHSDANAIPTGLIHISQNLTVDTLIGKVGKQLKEDFHIVSNASSGSKETVLHYDGENYTLDFSAYLYPHFAVMQTLKRLLANRYTCFLYQPMFKTGIYALLIIEKDLLNDFVAKESLWFDQSFARLQDGFDGFAALNAMQQTKEETKQDTRPAYDASKAKKPNPEIAKKQKGTEFYDHSYQEYKRKHDSAANIPYVLLGFLGLAVAGFLVWCFSHYSDQENRDSAARTFSTWNANNNPFSEPVKVDASTIA